MALILFEGHGMAWRPPAPRPDLTRHVSCTADLIGGPEEVRQRVAVGVRPGRQEPHRRRARQVPHPVIQLLKPCTQDYRLAPCTSSCATQWSRRRDYISYVSRPLGAFGKRANDPAVNTAQRRDHQRRRRRDGERPDQRGGRDSAAARHRQAEGEAQQPSIPRPQSILFGSRLSLSLT